ncbi:hypothetical protein SRHO_G00251850 [Serrasalmus rhombeus]
MRSPFLFHSLSLFVCVESQPPLITAVNNGGIHICEQIKIFIKTDYAQNEDAERIGPSEGVQIWTARTKTWSQTTVLVRQGLCLFESVWYDKNGFQLLPDLDTSYYVVGNLNSAGADELPDYVSEDYTGLMDDSNMDRIIVSLDDDDMFDRVYVTEHDNRIHYNPNATYRISKGLLQIVSTLDLQDFLRKTGYLGPSGYIFQGVLISRDPQPVNTNVASATPKVNAPQNRDCRIEIDSALVSAYYGNDWTTTGYSSRRKKCCECTIL